MNKEIVEKIENLISDMDLPIYRKQIKNKSNVRWLLRNLKIKNSENSSTEVAIYWLKQLL